MVGGIPFYPKRNVYVHGDFELRLPPTASSSTEIAHIPTGVVGRGKSGVDAWEDLRIRLSQKRSDIVAALVAMASVS